MYDSSTIHDEPESPEGRWRRGFGMRTTLSLVALCTFGAVAVFGTQAAFSDNVTMGQISVTGGSLDMVANNDTGDSGVAWSGNLSVALTGLQPGDVKDGTVEIENAGDLPYTLVASTSGTDASGCFGYYLRETAVTGGSGAAVFPVDFAGFGTGSGTDVATAAFPTAVSNRALPDNGADVDWEAGDKKVYTISVRMKSSCTTNAANGTLDVAFDAAQV